MAIQPKGQRCETCRYWFRNPEPDDDGTNDWGECRRHPPQLVNFDDQDAHGLYRGVYVESMEKDWCGEWSPANPETVEDGAAQLARLVLLGDLTAARVLADKLRE